MVIVDDTCIDIHSIWHAANIHVDQPNSLLGERELHKNTHRVISITRALTHNESRATLSYVFIPVQAVHIKET